VDFAVVCAGLDAPDCLPYDIPAAVFVVEYLALAGLWLGKPALFVWRWLGGAVVRGVV
jgi:hypothetical protein